MLRRIVSGVTLGVATCAVLSLIDGCLTRPVEHSDPVTKTNFITSIPQGSIDKVDILFDIDNSASMGDKQAYLSQAIPDLLTRLVTPNCLSDTDMSIVTASQLDGTCPAGSTAEFPPVHNMHIGIISSSLGARLGDACPTTGPSSTQALAGGGTLDRHNDDQAHLLDRGADPMMLTNYTENQVAAADPDHFLNWFPPASVNAANAAVTPTGPTPVVDPTQLQGDFQHLVVGVHQFGCGIESQLENWYRFLIQPDPYASLAKATVNGNTVAQWVGVDTTILAQRADFLRPDSLVAILVLTDENDSEVDVRSFGGTGYNFMATTFNPPRGTSQCANNPGDPNCTSCAFPGHGGDSACAQGAYTAPTDWGYDLNLRHVHEKLKYGASVQFPIQRYVVGLTSPKVPDRNHEYPTDSKGNYASSYQGLVPANLNCTNPLYAAKLPTPSTASTNLSNSDLQADCNLAPGTRKPGLVYYAHIGGVPHQLLQVDPTKMDDASQAQKDTLTDADWTLILGKDPENFDYSGIDPHMIESYKSRKGSVVPTGGSDVADSSQSTGADPIAGKEWTTDSLKAEHQGLRVDREYACIFKLATPRDCSDTATMADPTLLDSCDCQPPQMGTGTFTKDQVPAVCNDTDPTKYTEQDSAKAYPTIRELTLARLLGQVNGANEGIISSLCPIHTTEATPGDPLYGYRPAMNVIIKKLAQSLAHQCLPQRLVVDPTINQVPCLVLGTFPSGPGAPTTCTDAILAGGYEDPDSQVLAHFKADQHAAFAQASNNGGATDPSTELTCQLKQLPPNADCTTGPMNGWCYIDNGTVKGCAQAIIFNKDALKAGVTTSLQCIEASDSVTGGGTSTGGASDAGTGGGG